MKKVALLVCLLVFLGVVAGCTSKSSEVSHEPPPAAEPAVSEQPVAAPESTTELSSQPVEATSETATSEHPKE